MKISLHVICWFCCATAFGQPTTLQNDLSWFKEQTRQYQRWLDHEGLGSALRVHDLEVDTMVVLYLGFRYTGRDSVVSSWNQLKNQFDAHARTPLETRLFYRATGVFDVDADHMAVKIFDTYHLDSVICFYRGIYALQGVVTVDTSTCRAKTDYIVLQAADLGKTPRTQQAGLAKRISRVAVFAQAKIFLNQRYGAKQCQYRQVRLEYLEDAPNSDVLELEVFNLCDEVIREGQPKLAEVLNYFGLEKNWKKNEKLVIRLQYKPSGNGFLLDISIDGRYGSGFYENVGRRGYKDMEVDFDEELTAYTRLFKRDLNDFLLQRL